MNNLTYEQRLEIRNLAKEAAREFVQEFGEPIDTDLTDWDFVAWNCDRINLSFIAALESDSRKDLTAFKCYSAQLEIETQEIFDDALLIARGNDHG